MTTVTHSAAKYIQVAQAQARYGLYARSVAAAHAILGLKPRATTQRHKDYQESAGWSAGCEDTRISRPTSHSNHAVSHPHIALSGTRTANGTATHGETGGLRCTRVHSYNLDARGAPPPISFVPRPTYCSCHEVDKRSAVPQGDLRVIASLKRYGMRCPPATPAARNPRRTTTTALKRQSPHFQPPLHIHIHITTKAAVRPRAPSTPCPATLPLPSIFFKSSSLCLRTQSVHVQGSPPLHMPSPLASLPSPLGAGTASQLPTSPAPKNPHACCLSHRATLSSCAHATRYQCDCPRKLKPVIAHATRTRPPTATQVTTTPDAVRDERAISGEDLNVNPRDGFTHGSAQHRPYHRPWWA